MQAEEISADICTRLEAFEAVQVGSYPIHVNVAGSDVDIICCYSNENIFIEYLSRMFSANTGFHIGRKNSRGVECIVCRFTYGDMPVEIFGQQMPVKQQYAWRHMEAERRLLKLGGDDLREKIMALRLRGVKTEQAFATALNLEGDPYETLLTLFSATDEELARLL